MNLVVLVNPTKGVGTLIFAISRGILSQNFRLMIYLSSVFLKLFACVL